MRGAILLAALALALKAAPAAAHGLGQRYDLPLPLGLFLGAAAAAVALTFLLLLLFLPQHGAPGTRRAPCLAIPLSGGRPGAAILGLARALVLALFLLAILTGLLGNQDPFKNLTPVAFWVIGWVGLAFACALFGDLYRLINPFDTAFRLIERVAGRGRRLRRYRLGRWPAVALFLLLAWGELVWPARDQPAALAGALLAYSLLTWSAMWLYGREIWREEGEVFAAIFGLFARFAPLGFASQGVVLRPPGAGLLPERPVPWSLAALVLLLLSTVTLDGLLETPLWSALATALLADDAFVGLAEGLGVAPYSLLTTLALLLFPPLFSGAYLLVTTRMARAARNRGAATSAGEMARLFVLTLVPIAVAYHLAHYLSYLLLAGQFIIPLASDPFGWGWNLFGTKLYLIDIGIVDARFAWYAAILLIVAGHAIAVWLAHLLALRRFSPASEGPGAALASQLPLLLLMVAYTAVSLWILAQPITEFSG